MNATKPKERQDAALLAARDLAELRKRGDRGRAEALAVEIDALVGRWRARSYVWPAKVAGAAGVSIVRRRRT